MPQFHLLPDRTDAQQATQDYALEAGFLRTVPTPEIPRLSNNQEDGSGTARGLTERQGPERSPGARPAGCRDPGLWHRRRISLFVWPAQLTSAFAQR